MNSTIAISIFFIGTFFGSLGAYFIKKGSTKLTINLMNILLNKNLLLGVAIYGLGIISTTIAFRGEDLVVLAPINTLTYVWSFFFAKNKLNEKIGYFKWLGMLFVFLGIILVII